MPLCLILSIIRYESRVSGAIQGKEECSPLHLSVVAIEKGAFSWFFGFFGISTFVGYLMLKPFYTDKQFYFKQSVKHNYTVQLSKTFLFQAIQFSQTVLI